MKQESHVSDHEKEHSDLDESSDGKASQKKPRVDGGKNIDKEELEEPACQNLLGPLHPGSQTSQSSAQWTGNAVKMYS